MNETIRIRPAFYDDEDAIVRIMNQGIEMQSNAHLNELDNINGRRWFNGLKTNSNGLFVAELHGCVVGWTSLSAYRSGRGALVTTEEISFYVDNQNHRKGIDTKMIEYAEHDAMERDVNHLVAILLDDNLSSRKLLERHQYFVWGLFERIVHFENKTCGHLYMGKHL